MHVIDYSHVPDRQLEIHQRLERWARWVTPRHNGWHTHPMWKEYRSNSWQWHYLELKEPLDVLEAVDTEKTISKLPEKHRTAIRWNYVFKDGPLKMSRYLGVSREGLLLLVQDGRDMVKNRLQS